MLSEKLFEFGKSRAVLHPKFGILRIGIFLYHFNARFKVVAEGQAENILAALFGFYKKVSVLFRPHIFINILPNKQIYKSALAGKLGGVGGVL